MEHGLDHHVPDSQVLHNQMGREQGNLWYNFTKKNHTWKFGVDFRYEKIWVVPLFRLIVQRLLLNPWSKVQFYNKKRLENDATIFPWLACLFLSAPSQLNMKKSGIFEVFKTQQSGKQFSMAKMRLFIALWQNRLYSAWLDRQYAFCTSRLWTTL